MGLIKFGEALTVKASDLKSYDEVRASINSFNDQEIEANFAKIAQELKVIAPKANDFLYFTATMMHAAEASILNDDGSVKKDAKGNEVTASWEKKGKSVKWVCSDSSIQPYRNNNRDIFPEEELVIAHKKWVGKPLCLDHKSSSVDMIRGLIIDTYYDYNHRRVIALCALDKKNYPDLARKVSSGYATCVSMGTGVERACCTDCGKVASVEAEFCSHMKLKSCYGEINLGLNPLELSIVVNGADQKAKIRRIVASIADIERYVAAKDEEFSTSDKTEDKCKEIEEGLTNAISALENLKSLFTDLMEEKKDEDSNKEVEEPTDELEKAASDNSITLSAISENINKISTKISKLLEANMTNEKKAFWNGGGGVNEPTPGKPKYEKDPMNEKARLQDKHMVGQSPFPNVGPVDGMHPGVDSNTESSELELKKKYKRAEMEQEKSVRRKAALETIKHNLESKGYFNGGGEANEPTPGKPKYEKDPMNEKTRLLDKNMVGQAPFPGVGAVDGLHPSPASVDEKDELERKKKLLRANAKLTGKFVVAADSAGSVNRGESVWQIFADDKLVLSKTVNQLTGGQADALYETIRTPEYGKSLLASVRTNGIDKVASSFKAAQNAETASPEPLPVKPVVPETMDVKKDEVEESTEAPAQVEEKLTNTENALADLREEVESVLADEKQGVDALVDGGQDLAKLEQLGADGALSDKVVASLAVQRKIHSILLNGMRKSAKHLEARLEEIKLEQEMHANPRKIASAVAQVNALTNETFEGTRKTLASCYRLMDIYVKYAQGTENIVKAASKDLQMNKLAQDPTVGVVGKVYNAGDPFMPLDATPGVPYAPKADTAKAPVAVKPVAKPAPVRLPSDKSVSELLNDRGAMRDQTLGDMLQNVSKDSPATAQKAAPQGGPSLTEVSHVDDGDKDENDMKMTPDGGLEGTADEMAKVVKDKAASSEFDMTTKEGRTAYRMKLAEKNNVQFSKMLSDAHPKGSVPESLKTKGDLAKVETLEEVHDAMMKAVQNVSPKAKKAAEDIQKLVVAGQISADEVNELVSHGVDKDAVAYWKAMWGQAKDKKSTEFASDLVAEHFNAKVAEAVERERVKIARAYELAHVMVEKDAIVKSALHTQAADLAKMDDVGFNKIKQIVSGLPSKVASSGSMPLVGYNETVSTPKVSTASVNEWDQLFAGRKH